MEGAPHPMATPHRTARLGMCNGIDAELARRSRYKRGFDLALIGLAVVLLLPLWIVLLVVIPVAIWLEDRGPVFFIQTRAGMMGQQFSILKFRTLEPDAGNSLVAPKDSRLTAVGTLLRFFYLDELPQIVNVVKGDMSLVGPRPEWWPRHLEICREMPEFDQRLRVRPGIAGLAQVRGTYWSSAKEKLRYDNLYIDTLNPWLDLKLLCMAVITVARGWFRPSGPKHTANEASRTPSPLSPPPPRAIEEPQASPAPTHPGAHSGARQAAPQGGHAAAPQKARRVRRSELTTGGGPQ